MKAARSPLIRDVLLAAVFTAATQVELVLVADEAHGSLPLQHAAFALMTGALALRRTTPGGAAVVAAAGMALQTLVGPAPVAGGFLALLLVLASLGWHGTLRAGVVGLAATLFGALLYDVLADQLVLGDLVVNAVIVTAAWGAARAMRVATDRRVAAEVAADRAARDATLAERGRIARDLHDSLAHALTLITLQAGSARERTQQSFARETFAGIEQTGREALADMHRFLALMGTSGSDEAPGISDLADLAERLRAGGLAVHLDTAVGDVGASVSTAVYRVVQEALTNVVRHSDASVARVVVQREGSALVTRVSDDGEPVGARTEGSGRGLSGLAERLALFGGTLASGRTPGGWQVEARIPLGGPGR